jgi:hypothetical protein
MRRFLFISMLLLALPLAVLAAASRPDTYQSRMSAGKTNLKADGIDNTLVTVTVRDLNALPIENLKVTLVSDRGSKDEIRVENGTTDLLGKAYFRVFSLKNGTATLSAVADGVEIDKKITLNFSGGMDWDIKVGDLIKIPDDGDIKTLSDTAVYYYASNGKRYVFPNEKVYYTWYKDFSAVKIIPIDQMALIPIGGNVTYKAGSKLVKFQTDIKTYLPTKGGVLRWVKTEEVAKGLFGQNWNKQVDDITEAFYVNYKFGNPIESALDAPLDIIRTADGTIDIDKGLTH